MRPEVIEGDVREVLKTLDDESVQCVVTSPPYWGLRDYGTEKWVDGDFVPEDNKEELIKIFTLDIECTCENGFPEVNNPVEELLCITVKNQSNKQIITWGVGEFKTLRTDITYIKCSDERHLIMEFMKFWLKNYPDVITGWNTKFFDLPYLMNRIQMVAGAKVANRMSPWNLIHKEEIIVRGRPNTYYSLFGIAMLDYLDLYKWFIPVRQESYRLSFIGETELGETKIENPYPTFKDFYTKDFQKFVEYNIQDVEIVDGLEDKLGLIDLSLTFAYETKVNYNDIFSQVRVWDTLIANHLMTKKICVPPREDHIKDTKYEGAYVKEPIVGMHDWVVSFDLASLYPSIIRWLNLSPETKTDDGLRKTLDISCIIDGTGTHTQKMLKEWKDKDLCIAANGTTYTKEHQGFLPALMEKMYKERKMYKKKMIECQKRQQAGEKNLEKEIAKYHNFQLVRKIQLNSAYGAIGNEWFRYYDVRMAEAITLSGQLSIRWIADKLNEFLNKMKPRSMRESEQVKIAKEHLSEIKRLTRRLEEQIELLEEGKK